MSKSTEELIEYFEKEYNRKMSDFLGVDWIYLSVYQNLTEEFIRKFKGKVCWRYIPAFQILSGEFIEEFKDSINDYNYLSKHNRINWLKYKLKSGKISQEQYLKELLKCTIKN